jgi:hypothetical protein
MDMWTTLRKLRVAHISTATTTTTTASHHRLPERFPKCKNPYLRSKQRSITEFWPFGTDFGGFPRGKPRGIRPITIKPDTSKQKVPEG